MFTSGVRTGCKRVIVIWVMRVWRARQHLVMLRIDPTWNSRRTEVGRRSLRDTRRQNTHRVINQCTITTLSLRMTLQDSWWTKRIQTTVHRLLEDTCRIRRWFKEPQSTISHSIRRGTKIIYLVTESTHCKEASPPGLQNPPSPRQWSKMQSSGLITTWLSGLCTAWLPHSLHHQLRTLKWKRQKCRTNCLNCPWLSAWPCI